MNNLVNLILRFVLPLSLLLTWQLTALNGSAPVYLSAPSTILDTWISLISSGILVEHAQASIYRGVLGFLIGASLGLVIGLMAGLSRWVRGFFEPLVAVIYPIPKVAFLPVIIILMGLGHATSITIIAVSVFFPIFIGSLYSVRSVKQTYIWAARNMGAGHIRVFFRVLLPAALPEIFTSLRIGMALTFVVLFAAELLGSQTGLGYLIVTGEDSLQFDVMFSGIITFALLGFIGDRVILAARRHLLRGQLIGKEGNEV